MSRLPYRVQWLLVHAFLWATIVTWSTDPSGWRLVLQLLSTIIALDILKNWSYRRGWRAARQAALRLRSSADLDLDR